MDYLFTSESVSEGHPDKVADAISDAILDIIMEDRNLANRCACETLVTTNRVIIAGEYKGNLNPLDAELAARDVVRRIGYDQEGFSYKNFEFTNLMHGQSADIALGTDTFGAGDQGLMFGYACNDNDDYMPSAIYYSHRIVKKLAEVRHAGETRLGPDAKSQVTLAYDDFGPVHATKIVCSTQHTEETSLADVKKIVEEVIREAVPAELITSETEFLINPTGRFVIGGPDGDTGLTGRKIIVDTYGGYAPHGGGAFSGKDPTKVDRSAAYMARYIAKNIVESGKADEATVQLSYAIGVANPMSLLIMCNGEVDSNLTKWFLDNVDLTPAGIINRFDLFRPIYKSTTNYGHYGRSDLPWEKLDLFNV